MGGKRVTWAGVRLIVALWGIATSGDSGPAGDPGASRRASLKPGPWYCAPDGATVCPTSSSPSTRMR